ncbi:hypothetical protein GCM10028775_40550 [Catellatospora paridis]
MSATTVALLAAGLSASVMSAPSIAAPPACAGVAESEQAARDLAAACRQSVVIGSSRSEYGQVTVHADGTRTLEVAAVPQRVRQADGSWSDIDLGLARGADGSWRPKVSAADVAFSAGGSGPLVTLTRGGKTMTMSWPGTLPAPTVAGDTVTYGEVLPQVDLVVRATRTGFTHVLAVKSAAAGKNPKVRDIGFTLGGDARVQAAADGSLRAVAGDEVLASADPAEMWDSGTVRAGGRAATIAGARSSAAGAGDAARVAKVGLQLGAGRLSLRPDAKLLDAPDTVYPVYVDPTWQVGRTRWAYATNDGSSNLDYSAARVGLSSDTGAIYRSFFEFPTMPLTGKYIQSARVDMELTHSWSCSPTVTSMYSTATINATMKATWSAMTLQSFLDTATGNANELGCGTSQPNMTMRFEGSLVRSRVQVAADSAASFLTFGFTARDASGAGESSADRWKKFVPESARLVVDYDTAPAAPSALQVGTVACGAESVAAGTLTPALSAVFSDVDSGDLLTGQFEWIEVPVEGIGAVTDTVPARLTAPAAVTSVVPNTRATSDSVTVEDGKVYAFRARSMDRPPYSLTGPWSDWCQFTAS